MREQYFAAANTYNGFKSYFMEVFNPYEYERIYVIKGGPGTGKSNMMKKIGSYFAEKGCDTEEIYCSSDTSSLDGVICKTKNKKIAVLDGTAPHETDAKIPGAIDEIINLGENWDAQWLIAKKDDILPLNIEKSRAYKTAYSYLKIAGTASSFILDIIKDSFDYKESKALAKQFCQEINPITSEKSKIRLISSFGKNGLYSLESAKQLSKNVFYIVGDIFPAMLLLLEISDFLYTMDVSCVRFPTALNPDYLDAIYIPSSDIVFMIGDGEGYNADALIKSTCEYDSERIKTAKGLWDISLTEAKRWFGIASDLHFRLEKIYTQAMSFEKNDALLSKKLDEMQNILEV